MFCVAQFASIAGGILCAYTARKFFARWREWWGISDAPVPTWHELLINYGWLFVVIPIACVLLIPRHREDDDTGSVKRAPIAGAIVDATRGIRGYESPAPSCSPRFTVGTISLLGLAGNLKAALD